MSHASARLPVGRMTLFLLAPPLMAPAETVAQSSGGNHFGWEAVGGVGGAVLGVGAGLALASDDDCGKDLACLLDGVALAAVTSTIGSATGAILAGHLTGDDPSTAGAVLGGVIGAAVGLAVVKLEEESGVEGNPVYFLSFSVSQGMIAAAGAFLLGDRIP